MNAKSTRKTPTGTHSRKPGGTRPQPTTGTSPVAITYREHSTLYAVCSRAEMRMTQPMPTKPNCPTACGPSSHSPLPMEMPRAIRLGPTAYMNSSLAPSRRTPKTSSGAGRSSRARSGLDTPSGWVRVVGAMDSVIACLLAATDPPCHTTHL